MLQTQLLLGFPVTYLGPSPVVAAALRHKRWGTSHQLEAWSQCQEVSVTEGVCALTVPWWWHQGRVLQVNRGLVLG